MRDVIKITIAVALVLFIIPNMVLALGQVAGKLIIYVPLGGTNSSQFGLVNNENETVKVTFRAEGNVSKYLSFPESAEIPSQGVKFVDIIAKIPQDYNKTLGLNLTGYVYALQSGEGGQVKINVQARKTVLLYIYEPTQPIQQSSSFSGLVVLFYQYPYVILVFVLVILGGVLFYSLKKRKEVNK